jgi:hypothetical protein
MIHVCVPVSLYSALDSMTERGQSIPAIVASILHDQLVRKGVLKRD